jgi:hypothetical protein
LSACSNFVGLPSEKFMTRPSARGFPELREQLEIIRAWELFGSLFASI